MVTGEQSFDGSPRMHEHVVIIVIHRAWLLADRWRNVTLAA